MLTHHVLPSCWHMLQTGSCKTFTIYGTEKEPGLTPRGINELFKVGWCEGSGESRLVRRPVQPQAVSNHPSLQSLVTLRSHADMRCVAHCHHTLTSHRSSTVTRASTPSASHATCSSCTRWVSGVLSTQDEQATGLFTACCSLCLCSVCGQH